MEKTKFISLLHKNADPSAEQTQKLSKVVSNYPFFQSARALHLKGLHQHQGFAYNAALKKTAANTIDRGVLFDYITSEDFQQHTIAATIQKREKQAAVKENDFGVNQEEAEQVLDPELFLRKENTSTEIRSEQQPDETFKSEEQPAQFDKKEAHSFSDWLKLTKAKPIERKNDASEQKNRSAGRQLITKKQDRHGDIIDDFIANNPKIKPAPEQKKKSEARLERDNSSLMTETLAKVYWDQKNYNRAIQSYKILILKNPQKSGFFADQIRLIEEIKEKKQ